MSEHKVTSYKGYTPPTLLDIAVENSVFLMLMTVVAFAAVNVFNLNEQYQLIKGPASFIAHYWSLPLFFYIVIVEIRDEMREGGNLHGAKAGLPVFGALGGMAVPAGLGFVVASILGIPPILFAATSVATDIAFSNLGLKLGKARKPLRIFVAAAATVDDGGGVAVLAGVGGHSTDWLFLSGGMALVVLGTLFMRYLKRHNVVEYVPLFLLASYVTHEAHFEQGLCWVLLAALMPSYTVHVIEKKMRTVSEISMGIFGFAVAGVSVAAFNTASIALALTYAIGKPIGFIGGIKLGELILRTKAPITFGDLLVGGTAMATAFTVAMIIATSAFPPGSLQDSLVVGGLLTFVGIPATIVVSRWNNQRAKHIGSEEIQSEPFLASAD